MLITEKTKPKNSTIKPPFTLPVPCMKIQVGHGPPAADSHVYVFINLISDYYNATNLGAFCCILNIFPLFAFIVSTVVLTKDLIPNASTFKACLSIAITSGIIFVIMLAYGWSRCFLKPPPGYSEEEQRERRRNLRNNPNSINTRVRRNNPQRFMQGCPPPNDQL